MADPRRLMARKPGETFGRKGCKACRYSVVGLQSAGDVVCSLYNSSNTGLLRRNPISRRVTAPACQGHRQYPSGDLDRGIHLQPDSLAVLWISASNVPWWTARIYGDVERESLAWHLCTLL